MMEQHTLGYDKIINMADAIDRKYHREAGLEAEVVDLLAEGYTEREVAGQKGISHKTIVGIRQGKDCV